MTRSGRTALVWLFAAGVVAALGAVRSERTARAGGGPAGASPADGETVAGVAPAGAETHPWVTTPAGWRPLPELVAERPVAPGAVLRVEPATAFGDPAHGCFALVQRVTAPIVGFDQRRAVDRLLRDLGAAGLKVGPGVTPSEVPFTGEGFEGRMRLASVVEGGRVALRSVACFYNQREPARCRAACRAMLDSVGAR